MFRKSLLAFALLGLSLGLCAQSPPTPPAPAPKFDVVSIKPSPDIRTLMASGQAALAHLGEHYDSAHWEFGFASVQQLICLAYNVQPYQVTGPAWLTSEHFDVQAMLPQGATHDQVPAMLQAMLADRFGLTLHRVQQPRDVYALVVGPGGAKLSPSSTETAPAVGPMQTTTTRQGANASVTMTNTPNGKVQVTMADGVMHLQAERMSMAQLATSLTPFLDRPVVDLTQLHGNFQVSLDIPQSTLMQVARKSAATAGIALPPPAANAAAAPGGEDIFASVQKLGLRLDKRKAPVDNLVIDHIDQQPTAN